MVGGIVGRQERIIQIYVCGYRIRDKLDDK